MLAWWMFSRSKAAIGVCLVGLGLPMIHQVCDFRKEWIRRNTSQGNGQCHVPNASRSVQDDLHFGVKVNTIQRVFGTGSDAQLQSLPGIHVARRNDGRSLADISIIDNLEKIRQESKGQIVGGAVTSLR